MKYFILVGEASGDLHGSNLIKALKKNDSNAEFQFWGGDLMQKASGIKAKKHIKELAIMGFLEVLMKLGSIRKNFVSIKEQLLDFNPDALILIDYPGFNLRITPFAKKNGISTFYYISPKVWAWKQKRVYKIKQYVDKLFTILPFETEFYKQFDYPVQYVGNPLLDAVEEFFALQGSVANNLSNTFYRNPSKPIIAILPGSRKQEISRMLPIMIEVADQIDHYDFIIAATSSFEQSFYESFMKDKKYALRYNETYQILSVSEAAMVTSGTATLETALFNVPQVVCYKANPLSYFIGKNLVKLKFMSLVNLILNKEAVTELLQYDFTKDRLFGEIESILGRGEKRKQILDNYRLLHKKMGKKGASQRVAEGIISFLKTKKT